MGGTRNEGREVEVFVEIVSSVPYFRSFFYLNDFSQYLNISIAACIRLEMWSKMHGFPRSYFITWRQQTEALWLSVYLSVCLSFCMSICMFVYLSVCLSVCLSICLSVCLSIYLSVSLSVCLSVCLSISLSICPSLYS